MKLSEIYQGRLELAKRWELAANRANGYEEKLYRRENGLQFQMDASAIAHCLALWGDQDIEQLDIAALWREMENISWQYHNPWHLGLTIVRKELTSANACCSTSGA